MAVGQLIAELNSPDPKLRLEAINRLSELDPMTAAGTIVFLLKDPEPEIRKRVAVILSNIGKPAVEPLTRYLASWQGSVDPWLVELLESLKPAEGVDFLLKHLNEAEPAVRSAIAKALGAIGIEYKNEPGMVTVKAMEGLLELLRDLNPQVQVAAAVALGNLGREAAVNPLLDELKDDNPEVRKAAAVALGKIGTTAAGAELNRLANNDPVVEVQEAARQALEQISERSVRSLLEALSSADMNEWEAAMNKLLAAGQVALPPLKRLAKRGDVDIRRLVAGVLGMIGDQSGLEPLCWLVDDAESGVRLAAVQALGKIRHVRAAERLSQLLEDPDPKIAGMAANALEKLGELAVEPVFGILTHESADVRVKAIDVLGRLRHEGACERLVRGLKDGSYWVRLVSAQALGEIGEPEVVPALVEALDDANHLVRAMAAEALGKIQDYRASMKLLEHINDENDLVRRNVFLALARIGNPAAIPFLLKALDEKEVQVRLAAIEALGLLRAKPAAEKLRAIVKPWPLSREPALIKEAARWALELIESAG